MRLSRAHRSQSASHESGKTRDEVRDTSTLRGIAGTHVSGRSSRSVAYRRRQKQLGLHREAMRCGGERVTRLPKQLIASLLPGPSRKISPRNSAPGGRTGRRDYRICRRDPDAPSHPASASITRERSALIRIAGRRTRFLLFTLAGTHAILTRGILSECKSRFYS